MYVGKVRCGQGHITIFQREKIRSFSNRGKGAKSLVRTTESPPLPTTDNQMTNFDNELMCLTQPCTTPSPVNANDGKECLSGAVKWSNKHEMRKTNKFPYLWGGLPTLYCIFSSLFSLISGCEPGTTSSYPSPVPDDQQK